jgi:hypothetical protein
MRRVCIIVTVFFIVSCVNRSQEVAEAIIQPNILHETIETSGNSNDQHDTSERNSSSILIHENISREAVINTDSNYYVFGNVAGSLLQGQLVVISGRYEPAGFDVHVEIKTIDGTVTGYVNESNITYFGSERHHNLWFKDLLLTWEYYHIGSVEDIFYNDYGRDVGQDRIERERVLRLWRHFYSENRMRFTDNYLIIGNDEFTVAYRLELITKNGNIYTILLSSMLAEKFEITLVDDGNSITILNYMIKSEGRVINIFADLLNIRYIPVNEEKSEITRNAVIMWIDEQLAILTGRNQ